MDAHSPQPVSGKKIGNEEETHSSRNQRVPNQSGFLRVTWILLLLLGGFFLFASLSDLAADVRTGLPSDHLEAFQTITGMT